MTTTSASVPLPRTPTDLTGLRSALGGRVTVPGDPEWDQVRQAWNLAVDQRPALVVSPSSADDVAAAVRYAVDHGLQVAPQGTGHAADPLGDLSACLLLRTTTLDQVTVDPARRTARAGAGTVWSQVTSAAARHGLAALAGSAPDVGLIGYLTGGGVSWLGRSHGLACNSVLAFDVVTADGRPRRVDASSDPDLFWALRGGGGAFAAVTAVELRLLEIREVYAGTLFWPLDRAGDVLRAWRRWTDGVPESVASCGRLLRFPEMPEIPEPLRGNAYVAIEVAIQEGAATADGLLAPLRELRPSMDTATVIPVDRLEELHMDPPGPVPGAADGGILRDLSDDAIDALIAVEGAGAASPLLSIEFRHLGGAMARAPQGAGVRATLDGSFLHLAVGLTPDAATAEAVHARVQRVLEVLAPWEAPLSYMNFVDSVASPSRFFDRASLERLRGIRQRYDPGHVFRSNHPLD